MEAISTKLVSFSGIDGSGKSTQIYALQRHLRTLGFQTVLRTFWDDVVAFAHIREFFTHRLFKGDKGVGSPEYPISRRDKNVMSWYATIARLIFYFLDVLRLRLVLARAYRQQPEVIIFDRYIYDELANLPLDRWFVRLYVRTLARLSPRPDVAYLVDADPETALVRKPEYPLEFLRQNRDAYMKLGSLVDGITVIGPLPIEETTQRIVGFYSTKCLQENASPLVQCLASASGKSHRN